MKDIQVECGANQTVIIDKLFGPLAAFKVRVRLVYDGAVSDWVVERERPGDVNDSSVDTVWVEMARWDCQLDWWKET